MVTNTNKNTETLMAMTIASANPAKYPSVYADNVWMQALANSALATFMGEGEGQYTTVEIVNKLITSINSSSFPVEIVSDVTAVTSPSTTKLYLQYTTTSSSVLLQKFIYTGSAWSSVGNFALDTTNLIKKSSDFEGGKVLLSDGTDIIKESIVTTEEFENLIDEYNGNVCGLPALASQAEGSLADLMQKFRDNGNKIGGGDAVSKATATTLGTIMVGYNESNSGSSSARNYAVKLDSNGNAFVNVPWEGNDTPASATAAGIMSKNDFLQLKSYRTLINSTTEDALKSTVTTIITSLYDTTAKAFICKGFIAPLYIGNTTNHVPNCFGFTTTSDIYVLTKVSINCSNPTSTVVFTMEFSVGNFDFVVKYDGSKFSLYHTDYYSVEDSSTDSFTL